TKLWTFRKPPFPHLGIFHSQPESITDCMLKQVQNPEEVQYIEKRLPLVYKIREQKAVKNHFPFSTHDNRHCLQNVGEYFDFCTSLLCTNCPCGPCYHALKVPYCVLRYSALIVAYPVTVCGAKIKAVLLSQTLDLHKHRSCAPLAQPRLSQLIWS
uniref:Testis expressed 36 n=1 Tax=Terrapene triunguis TaxID=2587831 RepID=A0A674K365_9SAUR